MTDKAQPTISETAAAADRFMWNSLHLGNYDSLPSVIKKLQKAYSEDPKNFKTTSHLGFMHLWVFCERGRKKADSSVLEHVYLSNRYFKEAIKLNPDDPRLRGFQASTDMCEGAARQKMSLILKGYFNGLRAINKWPQFNRSAISFIESQRDTNSLMFKQGIKYQWKVIDECSCKKLDKKTILADPKNILKELMEELNDSKDPLIKRACWSSWIAPHNLEGFFLNFGDMLVKQGKPEEAKEIYLAAKLSPTYKDWLFQSVLEERLRSIDANETAFNKELKLIYKKNEKQIFINSKISCVACHQMSKEEFARTPYNEPGDEIYFLKTKIN